MAIRTANARWDGTLTEGTGTMRTGKGGLEAPYSFKSRFEEGEGSNPEELIGAAHAGCFSMAFSGQLGGAGITAESINTSATVTMEKLEAGWTVTSVVLDCSVKAPGAEEGKVRTAADNAKKGCPISRLLNAKIDLVLKIN